MARTCKGITRLCFSFSREKDKEILRYMETVKHKSEYIKGLIKADMNSNKSSKEEEIISIINKLKEEGKR